MSVLWQLDVVNVELVGGGREKNVVKIEERCSGHTLTVQWSVFTPGHQVETLSPESPVPDLDAVVSTAGEEPVSGA